MMGNPNLPMNLPGDMPRAGLDHNYAVWAAGTRLTFHNVPWNSDYRDVVKFASQQALDEYLFSMTEFDWMEFTTSSYAKAYENIRVGLPFNSLYYMNYLRVENPLQPVNGDTPRVFYYFIRDIRYVAPETTEIQVQLDVFQTFNHWVNFGRCYIERGHIGIANKNNFRHNGREFLTVPEGLDLGNEYHTEYVWEHEVADNSGSKKFHILVWSATQITSSSYGTRENPNMNSAQGSTMAGLPNGPELLWFTDPAEYRNMMICLSEFPWITQGIQMVVAVPPIDLPSNQYMNRTASFEHTVRTFKYRTVNEMAGDVPPKVINMATNWRTMVSGRLGYRYRHLMKFLTYPYCSVELTTYNGIPLLLKPENMPGNNLEIVQLSHFGLPNPRVMFSPFLYNARPGIVFKESDLLNYGYDWGEFMDMMTGFTNFPTFAVVNDSGLGYLAANAHSIAYQRNNADWSQQRALTANQLAYNQSSGQIQLQNALTSMGIDAATQQMMLANQTAGYRGATNAVASGAAAIAGRNPVGGLIGAGADLVNTAITMNQNTQSTGISNALAASQNAANVGQSAYLRDTNKEFGDFAAKGDYAMAIGAINAKVQDAALIQPTTSGQVGGEAFNLVAWRWAIHAKAKVISLAARRAIGEYWLRYGYAVNQFATPPQDLQVMTRFTYWKMRETYISYGPVPENYRQTIRGIFEKGVTVWKNPADIATMDLADNDPKAGIAL